MKRRWLLAVLGFILIAVALGLGAHEVRAGNETLADPAGQTGVAIQFGPLGIPPGTPPDRASQLQEWHDEDVRGNPNRTGILPPTGTFIGNPVGPGTGKPSPHVWLTPPETSPTSASASG